MIHDAAPKASAGLNGEWWELQCQTGPIPTETSAAEHSLGHALRSPDRVSPPSTGHPGCERCEWLGTGATVRKLLPGQAYRSTSAAVPTHLGVSVLARKAVGLMHYYFMFGFAPEGCNKITTQQFYDWQARHRCSQIHRSRQQQLDAVILHSPGCWLDDFGY